MTTNWRAIYERLFERGPDSFSRPERETIRAAIEEAFAAGRASASTPEETRPFLLRDFAPLVDAVERAAFRYHASDTQARRDKLDAARLALLRAIGASVSAAREEGRREGIEEAAREADSEAVLYRESADALDGQGNHGSAYGDIHGALACDAVAKRIRALAEKTETKP